MAVLEVYPVSGTVSRVGVSGGVRFAAALCAAALAFLLTPFHAHAQSPRTGFPSEWVLSSEATPQSRILSWSPSRLQFFPQSPPEDVTLANEEGLVFALDSVRRAAGGVFEVTPPTLPAGSYTLSWRDSTGADSVGFSISANAPPPPALVWQSGGLAVDLPPWLWVVVPAVGLGGVFFFLMARGHRRLALAPLALAIPVSGLALWIAWPSATVDPAEACLADASRDACLSAVMVSSFSAGDDSELSTLLARLSEDPRFSGGLGDHPCHEAAHDAGRALIMSGVALEDLVREPLAGCSTGLIHGAVEAWAPLTNQGDLVALFDSVCADLTSSWALEECWHGLGHAAGLRSGSRPEPALTACDALTLDKAAALCAQGVGMQLATTFMMGVSFNRGLNRDWLPAGLRASPPQACVDFAPSRLLSMCFAGAFTYLNFGYYGGVSGPSPSALPEAFLPSSMASWCSSLDSDAAISCAFGLGVGLADPPGSGTWPQKASPCRILATEPERTACAAGVVVNAVQDSYESLESVPESTRSEVCIAAASRPECLAGSALSRGWSLVLPQL